MNKNILALGIFLTVFAILLGAFGAHGLKKLVSAEELEVFKTGVQYQIYHAFGLIFVGILFEKFNQKNLKFAGLFFVIGVFLFSGSLYTITIMKVMDVSVLPIVAVLTPIGGFAFLLGWVTLLVAIFKKM